MGRGLVLFLTSSFSEEPDTLRGQSVPHPVCVSHSQTLRFQCRTPHGPFARLSPPLSPERGPGSPGHPMSLRLPSPSFVCVGLVVLCVHRT